MRKPKTFDIKYIHDNYKEINDLLKENECNDELVDLFNKLLDPVERSLLINYMLSGYNYSILAKFYKCSVNTIRKYINQIQNKIKEKI
jgi:DNA-directed RNA polymerase specialized sigma24 family protein